MTDQLDGLRERIPARNARARSFPHFGRALRALRRLLDEPDDTQNAFEVFDALDPNTVQRRLTRVLQHAEGRRLLVEQPDLLSLLQDRSALAALPEGSLGRAYLAHIERHGLDPAKLVRMRRELDAQHGPRDPALQWFADRTLLGHDLWHVLSGYGADGLGEAALLPFSWAQQGGLANAFLTLGAAQRAWNFPDREWPRYLWRAWRRGRRARLLDAIPYEELLAEPLERVRALVGIDPPEQAHPGGVLRSDAPEGAAASLARTA
jgi:ubiquinone biosynthesis protein COQ4